MEDHVLSNQISLGDSLQFSESDDYEEDSDNLNFADDIADSPNTELIDNEEEDDNTDSGSDEPSITSEKQAMPAKKKRKRKNPNLRRNIRNVLGDSSLAFATRALHEQEQLRLQRLGLSKISSLVDASKETNCISHQFTPTSTVENKPNKEVICIDSDSDDEITGSGVQLDNSNEVMILSSDSDEECEDNHFNVSSLQRKQAGAYYSELGLHTNDELNTADEKNKRILVNVNHPCNDQDIYLHHSLTKILKRHQVGGIRFLYDNLIESVQGYSTTEGNGCILAHAMGLGKTIQTITFIDIFLRYTPAKKVLCVVPVNTIQNWVNEFNIWLPPIQPCSSVSKEFLVHNKNTISNKVKDSSKKPNHPVDVSQIKLLLEDMVEFIDFRLQNHTRINNNDNTVSSTDSQTLHCPNESENPQNDYLSNSNNSDPTPSILSPESTASKILASSQPQADMSCEQGEGETSIIEKTQMLDDDLETTTCVTDLLETLIQNVCDEEQTYRKQPEEKPHREFHLFMIDSQKSLFERIQVIDEWDQNGGVLLIGYEMYRAIAMANLSKRKRSKNEDLYQLTDQELQSAICTVGPDLVVCDEGHRIRNYQSGISQALKSIKTRKRLVLTGYPLQNNLIEYWCMVDFVRPNYLGSRQAFANMFERPIMNGQCIDSTEKDKLLMRQRAHVLYSLLQGFVQRRGHDVLKTSLPPKQEYVLMVKMSPIQKALYRMLIELTKEAYSDSLNPIKTFSLCCKIWNHPDILYKAVLSASQGALTMDIINDQDDIALDDTSSKAKRRKKTTAPVQTKQSIGFDPFGTEAREILTDITQWAGPVFQQRQYLVGVLENSGKFVVLMKIIEECEKVGDKLLVFSQSLLTLSAIEEFLGKHNKSAVTQNTWVKGKDYFRLDGSTNSLEREHLIKQFNSKDNQRVRLFLLSTRAGCLGINLIGANRVVVFDVSWNPCHDAQAVCRVFRYGQKKACFIYRLVSSNTMEKKIYYRQISKQGISNRVVDEMNLTENFSKNEIQSLITEDWNDEQEMQLSSKIRFYRDPIIKSILAEHSEWIAKAPFKHESLLISEETQPLSGIEKRAAKRAYEQEKTCFNNTTPRLYPLQQNFPSNSPVVPVKPFLWRPPSFQQDSTSLRTNANSQSLFHPTSSAVQTITHRSYNSNISTPANTLPHSLSMPVLRHHSLDHLHGNASAYPPLNNWTQPSINNSCRFSQPDHEFRAVNIIGSSESLPPSNAMPLLQRVTSVPPRHFTGSPTSQFTQSNINDVPRYSNTIPTNAADFESSTDNNMIYESGFNMTSSRNPLTERRHVGSSGRHVGTRGIVKEKPFIVLDED